MDKNKRRIFAIGAHPDDIELGCGGTIIKHIENGDSVFVLILSNGEKGYHDVLGEECKSSLGLLGIPEENIFFGNLPDGFISDNQNTVDIIESYIKKLRITRIYTHFSNDRHQDHRNCSNAVSSAARRGVNEIFLFQGPSTRVPFDAHYFIGLSKEHHEKKINALKCYKSQIKKGIVDIHTIENIVKYNGSQHGSAYAEAFAINHVFIGENEI